MSKLADLGENNENLLDILEVYDKELVEAEANLEISGKKLEASCSENAAWMHYYDQRRIELATLVKYFTMRVESTRSTLFKSYKENYKRTLASNDINKYIDGEPKYIEAAELLLEIDEIHEQYKSVVETFRVRGYSLNNITKIRVAQLENIEI